MAQYCCKWNEHVPNFLTKIESSKAVENYVDVTLVCEGRSIKAHKLVLSTCSSVLSEMFLSNPCPHPIIILQDMKFSVLQSVINFMYRGEIAVQQDDLELLLRGAKALGIRSLIDICKEMLIGVLITDIEEDHESNDVAMNDSSPQRKRARKRLHDSISSVDKENINTEETSDQTTGHIEIKPCSTAASTFSLTSTSYVASSSDPLHSVQNSVPEQIPTKKNASTIYEDNPSPEKPLSFTRFLTKKTQCSDEEDDGDGALRANRKSYIWNFFTPLNEAIAECNICLLNKSYKSSISNLKTHLRKKHPSVDLAAAQILHNNAIAEGSDGGGTSSQDMHLDCPPEAYRRKRISYLWQYFTPIDDEFSECNKCLAVKSHKSSISNLRCHLQRSHPDIELPRQKNLEEVVEEVTDENGETFQRVVLRKKYVMGQKKSYLWNYFTPLNDDLAECNICLKSKSYKSSVSNLKCHLQKKHPSIDLLSAQVLQDYAIEHRIKPQIEGPPVAIEELEASENLDGAEDEETEFSSKKAKKPRNSFAKRTSLIWNYFTPINNDIARCRVCLKDKSYRSSISNLKCHLRKQHPLIDLTSVQEAQDFAEKFNSQIAVIETPEGETPEVETPEVETSLVETSLVEIPATPPKEDVAEVITVETSLASPESTSTMPIILKFI